MRRLLLLATVVAVGCRPSGTPSTLEARDAWAAPGAMGGGTAVHLVVENRDSATVALTKITSPDADSVLVQVSIPGSDARQLLTLTAPLELPPHDSLVLVPGARQLTVHGLKRALSAGDKLPLTLTFSDGRLLEVAAAVRAP